MGFLTKEGKVYLLNLALAQSVAGTPTAKPAFYVGLSTANRNWSEDDVASTVHSVAQEFETYTEAARPQWTPTKLADSVELFLQNTGVEAHFTAGDLSSVGGSVDIYGYFIISVSPKTGSSDGSAVLITGVNFASPETLSTGGVLDVNAKISAVTCA